VIGRVRAIAIRVNLSFVPVIAPPCNGSLIA